jgi:3'-phosphoadenosine 5'-phosphosulfate sulfotransferase (PAPS reductase)/FAD synthetase
VDVRCLHRERDALVSRTVEVPGVLSAVFSRVDAALFVSISGGKDSQAMLVALARLHRERGWACGLFAIHADLGRTEWKESLPHCQHLCDELGIFLKVVKRPQGDLLQEIQDRQAKLTGTGRSAWPTSTQRYCTADQKRDQLSKAKRQPFWPDAANRYCTADQKRGQVDKALRAPFWPSSASRYCTSHHKGEQIDKELRGYSLVVSAMGMRADESRDRAKKLPFTIDATLTAKRLRGMMPADALESWATQFAADSEVLFKRRARLAFDWLPIHDWTTDDVWAACGTTAEDLALRQELYRAGEVEMALAGWPAHPAYVYGNQRVSCSLCVLASRNDLRVGALHNPELFRTYVRMERESGFTFQHGKSLADVAPELLETDTTKDGVA